MFLCSDKQCQKKSKTSKEQDKRLRTSHAVSVPHLNKPHLECAVRHIISWLISLPLGGRRWTLEHGVTCHVRVPFRGRQIVEASVVKMAHDLNDFFPLE